MADQPAKKQKTDVETMGVSEMKALIKSAGLAKLQRACQGKVRALVASVSQIFMTTPPCMREDGPMDMAEFLCETGDGMGVNLLDRPAEQFGQVFDDDPDPAATVNTIRRGLRELGLSA